MGRPIEQCMEMAGKCGLGLCCLGTIATIITTLASCATLSRDEQMIVHYYDGKVAYNGPLRKVYHPFRERERRKAVRLLRTNYAFVKDTLNGKRRVIEGPKTVFLGAYEEHMGIKTKFVLKKEQYIRFVDQLTGKERIVKGPASVVPGPWENSTLGIQEARSINTETAAVILNKVTGARRLHKEPGMLFPQENEVVIETVKRTRLQQHEVMVVRNAFGQFEIQKDVPFFLQPFDEIVEFEWSTFDAPAEGELQIPGKQKLTKITMMSRRTPFVYQVRSSDNVALRLEGTIFWKVADMQKLIERTSDPVGDVWYKARSTLVSVISRLSLVQQRQFNQEFKAAFVNEAADNFYSDRGLVFERLQVTRWEPVDAETSATLRLVNEEATKRANQLRAQNAANQIESKKLAAETEQQNERTRLARTEAANANLEAETQGEAKGVQLAESAKKFIDGLSTELPDITERLALYNLQKQLESQNLRLAHITDGKGMTLFLTPQDVNLKMNHTEL